MAKKTAPTLTKYANLSALGFISIGLGIGILLCRAVFDPHPIRWGVGLIVLGILAYIYPLTLKK